MAEKCCGLLEELNQCKYQLSVEVSIENAETGERMAETAWRTGDGLKVNYHIAEAWQKMFVAMAQKEGLTIYELLLKICEDAGDDPQEFIAKARNYL